MLVNGMDDKCDLQKALFNIAVERELEKAKSLSIQSEFPRNLALSISF